MKDFRNLILAGKNIRRPVADSHPKKSTDLLEDLDEQESNNEMKNPRQKKKKKETSEMAVGKATIEEKNQRKMIINDLDDRPYFFMF